MSQAPNGLAHGDDRALYMAAPQPAAQALAGRLPEGPLWSFAAGWEGSPGPWPPGGRCWRWTRTRPGLWPTGPTWPPEAWPAGRPMFAAI